MKIAKTTLLRSPVRLLVENFDEIALSRTVKEIEAKLFFAFLAKIRKFKMAAIFWERKIFLNCQEYICEIPCGSQISTKSLYPTRLRRFWRKFKMAAIFGERKIFKKLPRVHFLVTLWVKNFDEIALSRTVKEIEANLCFAIFGKNSKWPPFLGRGNFFLNCQEDIAQIPWWSKISTKSLYLARLRR